MKHVQQWAEVLRKVGKEIGPLAHDHEVTLEQRRVENWKREREIDKQHAEAMLKATGNPQQTPPA